MSSQAPKRVRTYNLHVLTVGCKGWSRRQRFGLLLFLALLLASLTQGGCAGLTNSTGSTKADPLPSIITQPTSQTVTAGQTATFSVVATGTGPFSYQWRKNGTAVSGATSSSYTTPAETTSDSGAQFTVVVSNSTGSATSSTAILTVNAAPAGAPSIITQPTSQTVTAGQTATFSVVATGTGPFSYQWRKNGTAVSGATSSSYTTPAETTLDSGAQFTVVVSNSAGSATSSTAILTVNAAPPGAPLQIATSSLPYAGVGIQFQAGLSATGGVQPYHWSVFSGTLPPALSLNPNTGALSGTASQAGEFDFSAQVSDSSSPNPQAAMKALILSVVLALQIAPGGLPNGQVGAPYQVSLSGSGGVPPYNWNIVGGPPLGLSLNATSGAIAGTPTQAGTSTFTILLADSGGQSAQKSSSITIAAAGPPSSGPVVITPSVPPAVKQGTTFQFTANATGTWSCSGTDSSGAATACKGRINSSTGLYTAPATVTAQQSVGGYQLLPNNHIFNTRIDAAPVNSKSSAFIAASGPNPIRYYEIAKSINYTNGSTPTENEVFFYTSANKGTFPDSGLSRRMAYRGTD